MKFIFASLLICVALKLDTVVSHSGGAGIGGEGRGEKTKIGLFQFPGAAGAGGMPGGGVVPPGVGDGVGVGVGGTGQVGVPGGNLCPPGEEPFPCPKFPRVTCCSGILEIGK